MRKRVRTVIKILNGFVSKNACESKNADDLDLIKNTDSTFGKDVCLKYSNQATETEGGPIKQSLVVKSCTENRKVNSLTKKNFHNLTSSFYHHYLGLLLKSQIHCYF